MENLYIELLVIFSVLLFSWFSSLVKIDGDIVDRQVSLISTSTSHFLKAIAYIIILIHHFDLRQPISHFDTFFQGISGWALSVFFILSSYGVAQSEKKHQLDIKSFCKKRLLKLLKPLWFVNIVTCIIYWFIGANLSSDELEIARINDNFVLLGQHDIGWFDTFLLIIGFKQIDGVIWYVELTLLSYILFFVVKTIFDINNKRKYFLLLYGLFLLIWAVIARYLFHLPAHYYRYLWALFFGLLLSLYEKELVVNDRNKFLICFIGLFLSFPMFFENKLLWIFAFLSIISIIMVESLLNKYTLRNNSPVLQLSLMSYFFYLIHVKVLTIEYYYVGYISVLLPIAICLILSYLYIKITSINKK